jgi:hypothetical protein
MSGGAERSVAACTMSTEQSRVTEQSGGTADNRAERREEGGKRKGREEERHQR